VKSRRPTLEAVVPFGTFLLFLLNARRFCSRAVYFIDDPFISMRFAANLLEHGELSFNPGDRVEGYSNLLHVLLHALTFKLRGGVPDAASGIDDAVVVVFAASVLEVLVLGWLARRRPGAELETSAWYYAWVLTMASWPFAFWAIAGLETPIEGLLYASILLATTSLVRGPRVAWPLTVIATLLLGTTLLRFEGVIVALAVGAGIALHLVRTHRARVAAIFFAPVLALSAAYHLWRLAYFGQLLPNTFVAKATGGSLSAQLVGGASYCGAWFLLIGGGVAMAALALVATKARRSLRDVALAVADDPVLFVASTIVGTKVALVVWGGGDWMPGWRMLVPITPVALFLMAQALLSFAGEASKLRVSGLPAVALACALVLCGRGGDDHFSSNDGIPNEAGLFKKIPRANLAMAHALERGFGGSADEVAVGEAGLVPFEARHVRFMDLFGLVDRDMARQPGGMHRRVHVEHVLERAPAAVVFANLDFQPPFGPYQYGRELLPSEAFHRSYRRVDLGGEMATLGWALYLRRDVDPAARGLAWAPSDDL
jgi:hypothetical protein